MAVKFLDNTGLGYFWSKIKAWCNATFAAITHNQASNTINAMTGYSKPSSSSAIGTSDSLNSAMGKLEVKVDTALDDSNYVHKTGNEYINGVKQFIGSETRIINSDPKLILKDTSIERGTVSSSNVQNFALQGFDKNGRRTWSLMNEVTDHVANRIWLLCYKYSTTQETSDNCVGLSVGYNSNDVAYSEVFGNLFVTANMACISLRDTNITRNVAPSTDRYVWYCKNIDSNDANLSGIEHVYRTNKNSYLRLLAAKGTTTTNTNDDYAVFCLGFENDVAFATCPSTPDRNDIHDIVTRDWIPRDTRIVHTSGNESIAGVKDFTDSVYFLNDVFIRSNQPILRLRDMNADRTVVPSSDDFNDAVIFYDKDYNYLYRIRGGHGVDGSTRVYMVVYKEGAADVGAQLGILWNSAGQAVGYCPTPPSGQNDNAIATTLWVNDKLSGVVHTTGNETVSGEKLFTDNVYIRKDQPAYVLKDTRYTRGTTPSTTYTTNLVHLYDSNSVPMARLRCDYNGDKGTYFALHVHNGFTTDSSYDSIGVGFDKNQIPFALAPSTSESRTSGTDIVTRNWIPKDTRIVHTSGDETIDGIKTFTANPCIQKQYPTIKFKLFGSKRNVAPSTSMYWSFLNVVDDADTPKRFFIFRGSYGTDKSASVYMALWKGTTDTEGSGDSTTLGCGFTSAGVVYGFAPTPDASSNTNHIATTQWVRSYHSNASDERLKQQIDFVPDEILDAWEDVSFYQFKFNESVKEKGNNARLHSGVVAQRIDKVFKAKNLDVSKYGLFILEKWDKEPDTLDEDGNVICNGREAGEQYSIRYTEMLCMEAAYQRRKNKILENRISELETQIQNMLQILESLKGA